jgi:hypothetical protein
VASFASGYNSYPTYTEQHKKMRLIFKEWDSAFNPVVAVVGVLFLAGGLFGMVLWRHVLRHPVVLVVALLPTLLAAMGVLIVVREVQLFRDR